jgi:type II secretion system (T2SS) protein M
MKAFQSLSDSFQRLSRRERLMVPAGLAVSLAAVCMTQLVLPFADRWAARERAHAESREQWVRLQGLVVSEDRLRHTLNQERSVRRTSGDLLAQGTTPALAGSGLQALLRRYAEASMLQLDRVDVAGQPKAGRPGLLEIPVTLQGEGDIYGLVDFLFRVQHGERLLVIDELLVSGGFARPLAQDGGVRTLVWSLRAHGLYPGPLEGP